MERGGSWQKAAASLLILHLGAPSCPALKYRTALRWAVLSFDKIAPAVATHTTRGRPVFKGRYPLMRRGRVSNRPPGGCGVKAYRVYSFDGINRITAVETIEAETDAQAMVKAKEVATGVSFEIWDQHRLVARFGPS